MSWRKSKVAPNGVSHSCYQGLPLDDLAVLLSDPNLPIEKVQEITDDLFNNPEMKHAGSASRWQEPLLLRTIAELFDSSVTFPQYTLEQIGDIVNSLYLSDGRRLVFLWKKLLKQANLSERQLVAQMKWILLDEDYLIDIVGLHGVAETILRSPLLSPDTLRDLCIHPSKEIRENAAMNINCPEEGKVAEALLRVE